MKAEHTPQAAESFNRATASVGEIYGRQEDPTVMTDSPPKVSRECTSYLKVPARPIEVIAAEALADVNHSIRRLTEWGVAIEPTSRLHQAREILEHAVKTREPVPKHRGDDLGLRALELAFDYGAIAETLPKAIIASMKRELRDSLLGPINPPINAAPKDRKPRSKR